jgi:hypothetical protein
LKQQFRFLKRGTDNVFRLDIFCEEDTPDYVQAECGIENGGLIAVGLIKPGTDVGDTDEEIRSFLASEVSWSNGIGASPQEMWRIIDTRGSKAADTFTEEEGFGLNSTEVTGADQSWVFESLNVYDNRDFVAGVNKRRKWNVVFVKAARRDGGFVAHYQENVNLRGSLLLEQSTKTRQRWSWEARASTDTTPSLTVIVPESIFVSE